MSVDDYVGGAEVVGDHVVPARRGGVELRDDPEPAAAPGDAKPMHVATATVTMSFPW